MSPSALATNAGIAVRLLDGRLKVRCHVLAGSQVLGNVVGRCNGLGHGVHLQVTREAQGRLDVGAWVRLSPPASSATSVWPCRVTYTRQPGP